MFAHGRQRICRFDQFIRRIGCENRSQNAGLHEILLNLRIPWVYVLRTDSESTTRNRTNALDSFHQWIIPTITTIGIADTRLLRVSSQTSSLLIVLPRHRKSRSANRTSEYILCRRGNRQLKGLWDMHSATIPTSDGFAEFHQPATRGAMLSLTEQRKQFPDLDAAVIERGHQPKCWVTINSARRSPWANTFRFRNQAFRHLPRSPSTHSGRRRGRYAGNPSVRRQSSHAATS
jgi:hypothetical protein